MSTTTCKKQKKKRKEDVTTEHNEKHKRNHDVIKNKSNTVRVNSKHKEDDVDKNTNRLAVDQDNYYLNLLDNIRSKKPDENCTVHTNKKKRKRIIHLSESSEEPELNDNVTPPNGFTNDATGMDFAITSKHRKPRIAYRELNPVATDTSDSSYSPSDDSRIQHEKTNNRKRKNKRDQEISSSSDSDDTICNNKDNENSKRYRSDEKRSCRVFSYSETDKEEPEFGIYKTLARAYNDSTSLKHTKPTGEAKSSHAIQDRDDSVNISVSNRTPSPTDDDYVIRKKQTKTLINAEGEENRNRQLSESEQDSDNLNFDSDSEIRRIINKEVIEKCQKHYQSKVQKILEFKKSLVFKCTLCDIHFMNESEWRKHACKASKHAKEEINMVHPRLCKYCSLKFSQKSLREHLKVHFKDGILQKRVTFNIVTQYLTDMNDISNYSDETSNENNVINTASKPRSSKTGLESTSTIKEHDSNDTRINNQLILKEGEQHNNIGKIILYKCNICEVHFVKKHMFEYHLKRGVHTPKRRQRECRFCKTLFSDNMQYAQHLAYCLRFPTSQDDFEIISSTKILDDLTENEATKKGNECNNSRMDIQDKFKKGEKHNNNDKITLYFCNICKILLNKKQMDELHSECGVHTAKYKKKCFRCYTLFRDDVSLYDHDKNCRRYPLSEYIEGFEIISLPKTWDDLSGKENFTKPRKNSSDSHQNTILNKMEFNLYKCERCTLHLITEKAWKTHLKKNECKDKLNLDNVTKCLQCNVYFTNATYKIHQHKIHKKYTSITLKDFKIHTGKPIMSNTVVVPQHQTVSTTVRDIDDNMKTIDPGAETSTKLCTSERTSNVDELCKIKLTKTPAARSGSVWQIIPPQSIEATNIRNPSEFSVSMNTESKNAEADDYCRNINQVPTLIQNHNNIKSGKQTDQIFEKNDTAAKNLKDSLTSWNSQTTSDIETNVTKNRDANNDFTKTSNVASQGNENAIVVDKTRPLAIVVDKTRPRAGELKAMKNQSTATVNSTVTDDNKVTDASKFTQGKGISKNACCSNNTMVNILAPHTNSICKIPSKTSDQIFTVVTADSTTENEESATCFAKDETTCNTVLIENIIDDIAIKKEMIDEQMQDNIYNLASSSQIKSHQSIKTKEEIKSESDNTETQKDQMISSIIASQIGQSLGQYYDNSIKHEKNVLTAVHIRKNSGGDQTDQCENYDSIKTEKHNVKKEQDIQKHDLVDNIKHESIITEDKQEIKFENNGDDVTETKTERKVKTEIAFLKEEQKMQDENNHYAAIKTEASVLENMQAFECEQNESDSFNINSEDIYNQTYKDEIKSEINVPEDAWEEPFKNDEGQPITNYYDTFSDSGNFIFSALDNIKIVDCVSIALKVENPSLSCGIVETANNDVFLDIAHQTDVLDQNEDTRNTLILIEDEQEHEQPYNNVFLNNERKDNKKSYSEIEKVDQVENNLQEIIEDVNQFHDKIDEDEQKIPEDDNCKAVTIIVQSNFRMDKVADEQEKEGTMNEQSNVRMDEVDIKQMITEGENLIVAMNRQTYGEMNEKDISPQHFYSKEEAMNGRFDEILNGGKNKQKKEGTVTEQSNGRMDEKYFQEITEEYDAKVGAMNMNRQSNDEVDTQSGITEKENNEGALNVHSSSRTEKVDVEKDNYEAGAISEQSISIINAVNAKKDTSELDNYYEVAAMNAHSNGEVNIQTETDADKNNGIRAINTHVNGKMDEVDIQLETPNIVNDEVRNEEMHSDSKKNAECDQKEIVDNDYDPVEGTNKPTDDKTDDINITDGNADEKNDKIRTIINHTNSKMGKSDIEPEIIEILDDDDDADVEGIETKNWLFNVDIKQEVIDITDDGFVPARNRRSKCRLETGNTINLTNDDDDDEDDVIILDNPKRKET